MFCRFCGAETPNDSLFCAKCGNHLMPKANNTSVAGAKLPSFSERICIGEAALEEQGTPQKRWLPWVIAASFLAILTAVLIVFLSAGPKDGGIVKRGRPASDGTGYIALMDGNTIKINDPVEQAMLTPDNKHIVVLQKDGTLYVTDPNQEEKHIIDSNAQSIALIRNQGFYYIAENNQLCRVTFDCEVLQIGDPRTYVCAENNLSLLFALDNRVYALAGDSVQKNKLGRYVISSKTEMSAISDDGKTAVWATGTVDGYNIFLQDGEDRLMLAEKQDGDPQVYAQFSEDQKFLLVTDLNGDRIWVKQAEKPVRDIWLGSTCVSIVNYSEAGYLSDLKAQEISSLYIAASTEDSLCDNLYRVTLNGARELLIAGVRQYDIAGNYITYTNAEGTLFFAELDANKLSKRVVLASDVVGFQLSANGKFVYFMKKDTQDKGTLYCYKAGTDEPVRVADDVAGLLGDYYSLLFLENSIDGDTVYFYQNLKELQKDKTYYGTLLKWTYGQNYYENVANDVVLFSPISNVTTGELIENSFIFLKYNGETEGGNPHADWMFWDGKNAVCMVEDIIVS